MRFILIACLLLLGCKKESVIGGTIIAVSAIASVATGTNLVLTPASTKTSTSTKDVNKKACLQYIKSPEPWQKKENWDLICDRYKEQSEQK